MLQWFMSDFEHDGTTYNCAEQFIMAQKARLFADTLRYNLSMASSAPAERKALGRAVSGFDGNVWDVNRLEITHQANLGKFGFWPSLRSFLLRTGSKISG